MVIEFGNWQLRPYDTRNWQLWHRHAVKARGAIQESADGWHPTGRFYQYNTIDNALLYAADCDTKAMEDAVDFTEYVALLREVLDGFEKSILSAFKRPQKPAK